MAEEEGWGGSQTVLPEDTYKFLTQGCRVWLSMSLGICGLHEKPERPCFAARWKETISAFTAPSVE